jgi:hypothetical protein
MQRHTTSPLNLADSHLIKNGMEYSVLIAYSNKKSYNSNLYGYSYCFYPTYPRIDALSHNSYTSNKLCFPTLTVLLVFYDFEQIMKNINLRLSLETDFPLFTKLKPLHRLIFYSLHSKIQNPNIFCVNCYKPLGFYYK